jgi:hypothetical protein
MTFHALKDLTAAVDSGRSVQQAMPLTNLSRELYQLADTKLGDYAARLKCCAISWMIPALHVKLWLSAVCGR